MFCVFVRFLDTGSLLVGVALTPVYRTTVVPRVHGLSGQLMSTRRFQGHSSVHQVDPCLPETSNFVRETKHHATVQRPAWVTCTRARSP